MARTLAGRCALITGSTQGLGLATAHTLAQAGCHIVLHGLATPGDVETVRSAIATQYGVRAIYAGADLRNRDQIADMMAEAEAAFGSVDVLVNNAVVRHTDPVDRFPVERWDEALAVNLSAAFHTIRLALPGMRRQTWGRIVNVSSIYGLTGAVDRAAYVTTKTALIGLTRAVALELAGEDITCNAVCPGTTRTPVHQASIDTLVAAAGLSRADAERRVLSGKQPSGRLVAAEAVAALVAFLCRPESRDITGAALPIDGGWSAA